jgi:hypothetical protein
LGIGESRKKDCPQIKQINQMKKYTKELGGALAML